MKIVAITESTLSFDTDNITLVNPIDYLGPTPQHWENYEMEYLPYLISEDLKTMLDEESIIAIDFDLLKVNKFLLAHHIITSLNVGVLYFSANDSSFSRFDEDHGLLRNRFIQMINLDHLQKIVENLDEAKRLLVAFNNLFDYETYKEHYQNNIQIDRHQATNEWGALKFLYNHGLSLIDIKSVFAFPETIFFKQKLREFNINGSLTIDTTGYSQNLLLQQAKTQFAIKSNQVSNILLIDDNADKGWRVVVKKLFPNSTLDIKLNYDEALNIPDFGVYDFVFLDLRLPTNQVDRIPKIENGMFLIEKIKSADTSLHVPLIVFTASQKAVTLHLVQQKGADAMYVKQPPYFSLEQSLDNYYKFILELNTQIDKGLHLKYYWELIVKCKNNLLPEILDQPNKILKSRIIERLEMFYGLIKKSYEQYSYNDSKFHFSSDILSFMTLWSTLNEIQECHFEKGGEFSHIQIDDSSNPGHYLPIELDDWAIKNQLPKAYFVLEKPIFEEDIEGSGLRTPPDRSHIKREMFSKLKYNKNTSPFYSLTPKYTYQRVGIKKILSSQIAYILLAKNTLKNSTKKDRCLTILKASNDQRNNLYLTHGESLSTSFHSDKEQNKQLPNNITKDLFDVIIFLLTGLDSHI